MGEARSAEIAVAPPKGEGHIVMRLQNTAAGVKVRVNGEEVIYEITIQGKAIVVENESNYMLSAPDQFEEFERKLNEELQASVEKTLLSIQRDGADPLGLGLTLSKSKPKDWNRLRWKWDAVYKQAKIKTSAKVRIGNTGTVLKGLGFKDEELIR